MPESRSGNWRIFYMDTQNFITKAEIVHLSKYDYSKVKYVKSIEKVIIICKEHGNFNQSPNKHLSGRGCYKCKGGVKIDSCEFISKALKIHKNVYDYSLVKYERSHNKVKIICKTHGIFLQSPTHHLSGEGCPKCAGKHIPSTIEFIEKAKSIHGCKYNYSKVDYKHTHGKVTIICEKHGEFKTTPANHLLNKNCPKCIGKISKSEIELQNFVKSMGFKIKTNNRNIIRPKELDIYIPELQKAIEFNGLYWHYSDRFFQPGKHALKSNLCRQKGIRLLHLREELWLKDQEKMKSIIEKFLNERE